MKKKRVLSATMALMLCFMLLISGSGVSLQEVNAAEVQTESSGEIITNPSVEYHTITVEDTSGGKVVMDNAENTILLSGNTIVLSINSDDGYVLSGLEITDTCGNNISYTDINGNDVSIEEISEKIMFTMPYDDVFVNAKFESTKKQSVLDVDQISEAADMSEAEIMDYLNFDIPTAVKMNNYGIATTSAFGKDMILTKNKAVFTCVNPRGVASGESFISLTDNAGTSEWTFCLEPHMTIGVNASIPGYVEYNGSDPLLWLKHNYGWNYTDIVKLTRAVKIAAALYSHHGYCSYALRQNVIWHYVAAHNSKGIGKYYILCNGQKGSYTCSQGHMNSKASVDNAVAYVWQIEEDYEKLPSYNASQIYATAGETKFVADKNNVAGFFTEFKVIGSDKVKVSNAYDGTYNGIAISSTAECTGKTAWIRYTKNHYSYGNTSFTDNTSNGYNQLKYDGADAMSIYTCTGKQTVAIINTPISRVKGFVKVTFAGGEKTLNAKYFAKDKITPALDLYIEKTDADTGEFLADAVFEVYMDDHKMGTVITDENGMACYHWKGDAIWTDEYISTEHVSDISEWTTKYLKAKSETLDKVSKAVESLKIDTKHKWQVKEITAPDGYEINTEVWEQTLDLTTTAVEVQYRDVSANGYLCMNKVAADATLITDNPCYSLEGAVYGIYKTVDDAKTDKNRVDTLTTDKSGNSNIVKLNQGIYYVKEQIASKGYELCKENRDNLGEGNEGIHKVVVKAKETTSFTCKEIPGNAPFALTLQKMDKESGKPIAPGDTSLGGAIFELAYYANTDGNTDGRPFKKWYFQTDENGYFICSNPKYLLNTHTMEDGTVYTSDKLFGYSNGSVQYPIGTYTIKEVSAPRYFQKAGYMNFRENVNEKADVITGLKTIVRQDGNGQTAHVFIENKKADDWIDTSNLSVYAYDEAHNGSITIYKKISDGTKRPLSGVTFKMVGLTTKDEYKTTTDENGKIFWENLVAQKYVITEIKTVDGMNLLKDNITVTMPMEMTLDEIKAKGADINQSVFDEVAGKYCFYNLTFNIDNSIAFDMPVAGEKQTVIYVVLIAALAAVAAGIWLMMRNKKK
mgnify:CR=1 FL=1